MSEPIYEQVEAEGSIFAIALLLAQADNHMRDLSRLLDGA